MNPSAAAHQAVSPNEIYIDQTLYTGRPDNFTLRLPKEQRVYTLLDSLGLSYTRIDHDPTETIESCHEVERLLDIRICKNLFLCNAQKTSFYLLMMPGDKKFRTAVFSKKWDVPVFPLPMPHIWRSISISPRVLSASSA